MTELDPRGLEAAKAAYNHAGRHWQAVPKAIAAYLEATQPEGEPDRIAVVVNGHGRGAAWTQGDDMAPSDWGQLERHAETMNRRGPFARAIVEVHLPRPAEPVTVQGRVR